MLVGLLLTGCGSAHLDAGRRYLANGNLPVAIEILDRGLSAEPGSDELRDTAISTRQGYEHVLRQEIDRLKRSRRFLLALGRLVELEDLARRARQVRMPGELPEDLERERHEVVALAMAQLGRTLDQRQGRGAPMKADLEACRQVLALAESDASIARTCNRLLSGFKLHAILKADANTWRGTGRLLPAIESLMADRNPELIALTDEASQRHNAIMILRVGEPIVRETTWVLARRDAFHRWVAKLDSDGRQVEETVIVGASNRDLADWQEGDESGTEEIRVRKKVWELISGEYRVFHSQRRVTLPYEFRIEDLRNSTIAVSHTATIESLSRSSYYEYSGDPRGHVHPPVPAKGRRRAPALQSSQTLTDQALGKIPAQVVRVTLERLE